MSNNIYEVQVPLGCLNLKFVVGNMVGADTVLERVLTILERIDDARIDSLVISEEGLEKEEGVETEEAYFSELNSTVWTLKRSGLRSLDPRVYPECALEEG